MADSQSMTPESDDILARERAGGTYSYQWRQFARWCEERVRQFLPASTEDIADYLKARYAGGARPSTLRVITSAIARVHLDAGYENPCSGELSSDIADWYEKGIPIPQRSLPLDLAAYIAIRETAHQPRRGRGGHFETESSARRRGAFDVAVIGLMRDGRLRVREATLVRWADIESAEDGSGSVVVRGTDGLGEPERRFISPDTMELLAEVREGASDDELVIGLMPRQLTTRIGSAARQAGLGEGYSAESPCLGMLKDLETVGISLLGAHVADAFKPDDAR